jgi:hypothetical protein
VLKVFYYLTYQVLQPSCHQILVPFELNTATVYMLCGIWGGQSGVGAGFLRVLWFPLPIFIPPISPQSPPSIIWGWYNRPVVTTVPSELSLTPLTAIKKTVNILALQRFNTIAKNTPVISYNIYFRH